MKRSPRLIAEHEFVERKLEGLKICRTCNATLATFAEVCSADLSEVCPGFLTIEAARKEFNEKESEGKP